MNKVMVVSYDSMSAGLACEMKLKTAGNNMVDITVRFEGCQCHEVYAEYIPIDKGRECLKRFIKMSSGMLDENILFLRKIIDNTEVTVRKTRVFK